MRFLKKRPELRTEKKSGPARRRETWARDLEAYMAEVRDVPFAWGSHDCCTFAAGAVEAMTGENPIPASCPPCGSREDAFAILDEAGGLEALVGLLAVRNGWRAVPPALARRGDLMIFAGKDDGPLLAVNVGASAVGPTERGTITIPAGRAVKAWHIE